MLKNIVRLDFFCFIYLDNIDESLPSFEIVSGDTEACFGDVSLCVKVTYSDGSNDIISAKESKRSKTVLKGRLQSTKKKVVIILADEDDSEDTVIYDVSITKTFMSDGYILNITAKFKIFFRLFLKAIKLVLALDLVLILMRMALLLV